MHAAEFPLLSVGQFGLLAAQFPLARVIAIPSRMRMRMRSASNSAKVLRILKNIFPIESPGSWSARPRASFTSRSRSRSALEYRPSRRSGQIAETRRADRGARALGPHLTPWVGPHPAHRRILVAKTSIAALAYDSAPYRSRPGSRRATALPGWRGCPTPVVSARSSGYRRGPGSLGWRDRPTAAVSPRSTSSRRATALPGWRGCPTPVVSARSFGCRRGPGSLGWRDRPTAAVSPRSTGSRRGTVR